MQLRWMGLEPTAPESNVHLRSEMEHQQLGEAFHCRAERGGKGEGGKKHIGIF